MTIKTKSAIKKKLAGIFNRVIMITHIPMLIAGLILWTDYGSVRMLLYGGKTIHILNYPVSVRVIGMLVGFALGCPAAVIFWWFARRISALSYNYRFVKGTFQQIELKPGKNSLRERLKKAQIQMAGTEMNFIIIGLLLVVNHYHKSLFNVYFIAMMLPYVLVKCSVLPYVGDLSLAINELMNKEKSGMDDMQK